MAESKETSEKGKGKAKRLKFDPVKAKKSLKPAAFNVAGAVGGGIVGAVAPPVVSGFGGVVCILVGTYAEKDWVTTLGAGMLVSTAYGAVTGANLKTAPDGKTDLKTELHNGKERAKDYLHAFAGKFAFWKKKEDGVAGLGSADPALVALDRIERSVIASGMDFANSTRPGLPEASDAGLFEDGGQSQEVSGFDNM